VSSDLREVAGRRITAAPWNGFAAERRLAMSAAHAPRALTPARVETP
jgi:hypothetical protein